jgi:hypothetical protein
MSDKVIKFLNKYNNNNNNNNNIYNVISPISVFEIIWSFDIPYNDIKNNFIETMKIHAMKQKQYYGYSFHSLTTENVVTICNEIYKYYNDKTRLVL